jgi:hypothetical protein
VRARSAPRRGRLEASTRSADFPRLNLVPFGATSQTSQPPLGLPSLATSWNDRVLIWFRQKYCLSPRVRWHGRNPDRNQETPVNRAPLRLDSADGTGISLRNLLAISLASISLAVGALLIYQGDFSAGDLTQTARIVGGATFLALGLTILPIVLKSHWKLKPPPRNQRASSTSGATGRRR